jgi:DNA repair exonuclease SbcCD ATPase subunit
MTEVVKERPLPTGEGLTYEQIMAMFEKDREQSRIDRERLDREHEQALEKSKKDWEEISEKFREVAEEQKEAAKLSKEADKRLEKLERISKRNSKQMGGLSNDLGALAENMVGPEIAKRFNELEGFQQIVMVNKGFKIYENNWKLKTQVDVLLENGEMVIAVEVKLKPLEKHIEHHIKQIEILKEFWISVKKDRKKFLGGIAGAIWDDTMKDAVHNAGLFVIEQSGNALRLDMPKGWTPAVF